MVAIGLLNQGGYVKHVTGGYVKHVTGTIYFYPGWRFIWGRG